MGEAIRHVLQTMFHHLLKKSGVVTSQTGFSAQFGTVTMSDPDNTDRLFCLFLPLFSLLAYMVAKAEKRRTEVSTRHTSSSTLHVLFHHLHHNMGYMLTTHISYTWDISFSAPPFTRTPCFKRVHACVGGWMCSAYSDTNQLVSVWPLQTLKQQAVKITTALYNTVTELFSLSFPLHSFGNIPHHTTLNCNMP